MNSNEENLTELCICELGISIRSENEHCRTLREALLQRKEENSGEDSTKENRNV
jgi:hypothetical protein